MMSSSAPLLERCASAESTVSNMSALSCESSASGRSSLYEDLAFTKAKSVVTHVQRVLVAKCAEISDGVMIYGLAMSGVPLERLPWKTHFRAGASELEVSLNYKSKCLVTFFCLYRIVQTRHTHTQSPWASHKHSNWDSLPSAQQSINKARHAHSCSAIHFVALIPG